MYSKISSGVARVRLMSTMIVTAAIASMSLANAETVMTFNGQSMDSNLVDAYIAGRLQKPIEQATAEERELLTNEVADVFLLSTLDMAEELEKDPAVAAQLELQRIGILARAVVGKLAEDIVVSEEEILATYEEQIKLAPGQQYKARHILVETQGEAVEIIELLIGGADFITLAEERSTGPSGPNGGDLGWFMPDQMVKPFSDAVVSLEDGRYTTDPIQTQFGWHVILREDSRAAEPPPLEGVRENIVANVQSEKLRAKIAELRAAAEE
jgi:peptidyl-prolyl cis-trans isomerase C